MPVILGFFFLLFFFFFLGVATLRISRKKRRLISKEILCIFIRDNCKMRMFRYNISKYTYIFPYFPFPFNPCVLGRLYV